jgi:hypothetical protein
MLLIQFNDCGTGAAHMLKNDSDVLEGSLSLVRKLRPQQIAPCIDGK